MKQTFLFSAISLFLLALLIPTTAFAQIQAGGVDKEGSWHAGEGLKKGDYFTYSMCHVDYKECVEFRMDIWIKGDRQIGTENQWLSEVVVYDGNKVLKGEMTLAKAAAPEPTGGSDYLNVYISSFKSSISWLSAFATSNDSSGGKGPKEFTAASWGKIANIGGEQIVPMALETVTVPAGTWETVQIGWKTGGAVSRIWIVDDFPFPIKAYTFTHVSTGIPPPEYIFSLLEYRENVLQSPFAAIPDYEEIFVEGCDSDIEKEVSIKKPTTNFHYQLHIFYGPEDPVQGCEIQFLIKFIDKYNDQEFLNQVQYDFLVIDDDLNTLRSIAEEEGRNHLYSPSGQALLDFVVEEEPGIANYLIFVYGLSPEGIVPSSASDYLKIPIQVFPKDDATPVSVAPTTTQRIPDWIKNNAGWWSDGKISDSDFVQGIQFLIKEGILKIPPTSQGSTSSSNEIPDWIKNNAGWWSDGKISDSDFVQGIQFLIKEGILRL